MCERDALAAVLVTCNLCDDLCCDVARGGKAVGTLDHGAGDNRAVLQHILKVNEVAVVHVLCVVVGIVEVDNALLVCLNDLLGKEQTGGNVAADLTCHVVALYAVDGGVLICIFLLGFFVAALNQAQNLFIGGVGAANKGAGVAVSNILFCYLVSTVCHDLGLDQILNLLYLGSAVHADTTQLHRLGDAFDLHGCHSCVFFNSFVCLRNGGNNFGNIERNFGAVSFNNLHFLLLLFIIYKIYASKFVSLNNAFANMPKGYIYYTIFCVFVKGKTLYFVVFRQVIFLTKMRQKLLFKSKIALF